MNIIIINYFIKKTIKNQSQKIKIRFSSNDQSERPKAEICLFRTLTAFDLTLVWDSRPFFKGLGLSGLFSWSCLALGPDWSLDFDQETQPTL